MPGRFDTSTINQVQQSNDIAEVISEHVNLAKKGREMVGLCPFHEDHRPSMHVNSVKQIFKCFACGAGGSVITFVQMRENLTFPQAVERLAQRAGIKIRPAESARRRDENSEIETKDADPNRLAKVNAWAADHFRANLHDKQKGAQARDYIATRKITEESAKKWQMGLALGSQDDLIKAAAVRKVPIDLLEQAGLIVSRRNRSGGGGDFADKFINRLMFTITDVTGRIIGFGGRTLTGDEAKYINSPTTALFDKSNCLYGLEQARHKIVSSQTAIVVEGYTDCIMAHQSGCLNVVATLGTSFTAGHGRILRRYARKVVLIFDSDTAGNEAANRALDICLTQHIDIRLASVPEGKDPCDFIIAAGREKFESLANSAADVFEFRWKRLVGNFSSDKTIAGNKAAVEEFLQTIATAAGMGNLTAIDKGLITNRLAKIIGIDSREINAELNKRVERVTKTASAAGILAIENQKVQSRQADLGTGLYITAQREMLEVLLNHPQLFNSVKEIITAEDFDHPILRQIAAILFETLNENTAAQLGVILAKAESVEAGKVIAGLAQAGEEKGNFQSRLEGAVEAMLRCRKQKEKKDIKEDDPDSMLRRTEKVNRRNLGMV